MGLRGVSLLQKSFICLSRRSTRPLCSVCRVNPLIRLPSAPSSIVQRVPFASLNSTQFRTFRYSCNLRGEVIEVHGPAFAESISEGDIRWMKQKGDFVNEDELVAEIETDKTSVEVPSPHSGTIVELLVEDGGRVTAKQKLYKLELGEAGAAATSQAPEKKAEEPPKPVQEPPKAAEPPPKPPTPKMEEKPPVREVPKPQVSEAPKAPLKTLSGTIPAEPPKVPPMPKFPISSTPVSQIPVTGIRPPAHVPAEKAVTGARGETRVKMNRMRQRIAQRLKDAQNTYAMLTTFNEIDMSNVLEMRSRYQKMFTAKHGVKLGLMSPFIRAAAYALQEQPIVNAVIDETDIVYRHFVDISIAVATPKGLVVPVLRNVETMDYAAIEKALSDLGDKARDNKLAIEEMEGGTFTISNGGVFGSLFGTPIVNPPQSAILGMYAIVDRPVAVSGKVEIRPMMTAALTYDHRIIDGREAVTFLKKIKTAVEDPRTILMSI